MIECDDMIPLLRQRLYTSGSMEGDMKAVEIVNEMAAEGILSPECKEAAVLHAFAVLHILDRNCGDELEKKIKELAKIADNKYFLRCLDDMEKEDSIEINRLAIRLKFEETYGKYLPAICRCAL